MVPTTTVPTSTTSGGSRWGKRLAMVVALAAALVASLQANGLTDGTVPLLHLSAAHGLRTSEVPDLTGVRALVTGASSGLGLGVSRLLVAKHASVLITARTEAKCKATLEALRAHAGPRADVQSVVVELLSLRDVVRAADEIAALVDSLDWLVLNAGIMAPTKLEISRDEIEIQFQTNHLSHFLMLQRLLPMLHRASSAAPKVVAVSSLAHWMAPSTALLSRADLNDATKYQPATWYGWSKLCNILMASELNRRVPNISAFAVHPGGVRGELLRYMPLPNLIIELFQALAYWDVDTAALTVVAPLVGRAEGATPARGAYLVPIARERAPSRQSQDAKLARELWAWSEALVRDVLGHSSEPAQSE